MLPSKVCTKCQVDKPITEYHKRPDAKDGKCHECKTCAGKRAKAHYAKDPAKAVKNVRTRKVRMKFGLTMPEYEAYMNSVDTCWICEKKVPRHKREMDHNHGTGEIRGVLCGNCNRGLGLFGDNPATLEKASRYLNERGDYSELRREPEACSP